MWLAASALVITQKSTVGGVVLAVTAGNLSPEATVWDFAVVLRSPANKPLADDVLRSVVLVDSSGRKFKPLAWEWAADQREHRAGILKFVAVQPRPDSIELRFTRPGEKKPRSFSWLLGSGMVATL